MFENQFSTYEFKVSRKRSKKMSIEIGQQSLRNAKKKFKNYTSLLDFW